MEISVFRSKHSANEQVFSVRLKIIRKKWPRISGALRPEVHEPALDMAQGDVFFNGSSQDVSFDKIVEREPMIRLADEFQDGVIPSIPGSFPPSECPCPKGRDRDTQIAGCFLYGVERCLALIRISRLHASILSQPCA
jgi:hypothetical protein